MFWRYCELSTGTFPLRIDFYRRITHHLVDSLWDRFSAKKKETKSLYIVRIIIISSRWCCRLLLLCCLNPLNLSTTAWCVIVFIDCCHFFASKVSSVLLLSLLICIRPQLNFVVFFFFHHIHTAQRVSLSVVRSARSACQWLSTHLFLPIVCLVECLLVF